MHDLKQIRSDPDAFDRDMARRGEAYTSATILERDRTRREAIQLLENARADHKRRSDEASKARAAGDDDTFHALRAELSSGRDRIKSLEETAGETDASLQALLEVIPNRPDADVPMGSDEADNVEIHSWGTRREFDFQPLEHHEIPGAIAGLDFRTASRLSGSRFCILTGSIARLHRALGQYMLDVQVLENGLDEVWTPVLVNPQTMYGTGQLPKFTEDSYRTENDKWLIPTAEVSLTNLVREKTLPEDALPLRYCAHSQCFRSEAGAAGKDTAGMLRQHQFEKVEMVSVTSEGESDAELERMRHCAEDILERLGIPYRTVILCTGDMGFASSRTYDIEVWLPGQGKYREISSVSNCRDFQARRMKSRYSTGKGGPLKFVHTLNGSGLAVGRTLIAVLENGQNRDGSIGLPEVIAPYIGGCTGIDADGQLVQA